MVECVEIELREKIGVNGKIIVEIKCEKKDIIQRLNKILSFHNRYSSEILDNKLIIYDTLGSDTSLDKGIEFIKKAIEDLKNLKTETITFYL